MLKPNPLASDRPFVQSGGASAKEKDLLLSLNQDFVSTSGQEEFLVKIWPKLASLFAVKNVFICLLEKDRLSPVLRISDENRKSDSEYSKLVESHLPINDGLLDTVLMSTAPCVYDLKEVSQWANPPKYINTVIEAGFKSSISTRLSYGNNQLGVLTFWSENENAFTSHHKELMELLAPQISIAVANMLANKSIQKWQSENKTLHIISNAIAAIRSKDDLSRVLATTLKSHIGFDDATIAVYNKDQQGYNVYVYDISQKHAKHLLLDQVLSADHPLYGHDRSNPHIPNVQDLEMLLNKGHQGVKVLVAAGLREMATIKLVDGDELIGLLVLLSEKSGTFSRSGMYLLQHISFQISTAVAKLITLEGLQDREKEKEILLTIGRELSFIREKADLLPLIKRQLDQISFYNDIVIAKVDRSKKTFSGFLVNEEVNTEPNRIQHPGYPEMRDAHHFFPDGVFEVALKAKEPVIFDLDEIVRRGNAPSYVKFIHENGTVEMIAVSLRDRNKEIGALFCFSSIKKSFTQRQLNLVQGIGNLIGTAVASILANEEIKTREYEKSILLALSNETAATRTKNDLFLVLDTKLKELFSARSFGISLINKDRNSHSPFLFGVEKRIENHPDFSAITSRQYPINDGIFDRVINSTQPIVFTKKELSREKNLPGYAQLWYELELQMIIGIGLRVAENNLGCLFLHLNPESLSELKLNLLKGVCSQVATALSNTLANETIAEQLKEIKRYKEQLEKEKSYLQEEIASGFSFKDVIGTSAEMQNVFRQLEHVSDTTSTVLILGETGTGKELIARAIHNASNRRDNLLVRVNCAAIPTHLIESEFFGHEKGAFTGAVERKIGKFEMAHRATLFLDEIGEIPLELQSKLLRALQEREIERVGGKGVIKVDIRIIAATNRNLEKQVLEGKFRGDLFYRLNVFPITIPPLRDRRQDISLLALHFMKKFAKNRGKKINKISESVLRELEGYWWPGNVRELEHIVERSVLLTSGDTIKESHLPTNSKKHSGSSLAAKMKTHEENERDHIIYVLENCNGKIFGPGGAAEMLGLKVSTLNSKMKKLGIRKINPFSINDL